MRLVEFWPSWDAHEAKPHMDVEEFARLTAAHGSGLDAVERQLEEERRLREECARAIRDLAVSQNSGTPKSYILVGFSI